MREHMTKLLEVREFETITCNPEYRDDASFKYLNIEIFEILEEEPLELKTEGKYKKFGSTIGKRIFLNPNILNQIRDENIPDEEERSLDVYFNYPYLDVDTVSIKLPAGYKLEAAPEAYELVDSFARYVTSYSFNDGILLYTRRIEYTTNRVNVENYDNYRKFIKTVSKSDQSKFIFKK